MGKEVTPKPSYLEFLNLVIHLVLLQLASEQVRNRRTELLDWQMNIPPDLLAWQKKSLIERSMQKASKKFKCSER